jgi:hypothetical protein
MARRRTLPENIRKYKQQYLRLLAYEARLNHQLFKMKKRIKLLVEEEQLRLTEKSLLGEHLQKIQQQKEELESQPACKQQNTQLKRVEKEYKQVKARHSRNQYQLDQLEVKKDKDNVVKLLVKEAKRNDVTVRIKSTYETWMYFEQIQQWELAQQQTIEDIAARTTLETNDGKSLKQLCVKQNQQKVDRLLQETHESEQGKTNVRKHHIALKETKAKTHLNELWLDAHSE